jgi:hypothetical protein
MAEKEAEEQEEQREAEKKKSKINDFDAEIRSRCHHPSFISIRHPEDKEHGVCRTPVF